MSDTSERVEIIKAVFGGLKDLGLVAASVATIWIQANNSGKLDAASTKQESIKESVSELRASVERPMSVPATPPP